MRKIFSIIPFLFLLFFMYPNTKEAAEIISEPEMKVKLVNYLGNQTSISLRVSGSYLVNGTSTPLESNKNYIVKAENGNISLYDGDKKIYVSNIFSISPVNQNNRVTINNREYLGRFQFSVENGTYVRPLNIIYLEDYIKCVVPYEMYSTWPKEALKVQAVAARTYAYKRLNTTIDDTTYFQAYGGTERLVLGSNATAAVDETTGEILEYNGSVIHAFYSASNGGMTENNYNEFGSALLPYLPIQKDDHDTNISWKVTILKQQIDPTVLDLSQPENWWDQTIEKDTRFTEKIKEHLYSNGYSDKQIKIISIPKLSFYEKTESGRVDKADLTVQFFVKDMFDETGKLKLQTYELTNKIADKIRTMIGYSQMRSTLISEITETDELFSFAGTGDGHGVGMSQYGANNRANSGHTYREILSFYYPGTEVNKLYQSRVIIPNYPTVKVQLNGKAFTDGYVKDETTYVHWKALQSFEIPYTYKGNGLFEIEGRLVQGVLINQEYYIHWYSIAPGKIKFEKFNGGFNFLYSTSVKVQLNGENFTSGYIKNGTTYVHWKALQSFKIPYTYKGNGLFEIEGRLVQGVLINQEYYIHWYSIAPGKIKFEQFNGGFNFLYSISLKVQLNGENFTSGYIKNGTTYVHWRALDVLGIPYVYKGNQLFEIEGRQVQGMLINGGLYIHWYSIAPGKITYQPISGGFNFIYAQLK